MSNLAARKPREHHTPIHPVPEQGRRRTERPAPYDQKEVVPHPSTAKVLMPNVKADEMGIGEAAQATSMRAIRSALYDDLPPEPHQAGRGLQWFVALTALAFLLLLP